MSRTKSSLIWVALLTLSTSGASFAQTTKYFLNPMPPVPPIQGTPFVPTALNGSDTIAGNVTIHGPATPNPPYGLQSVAYLTQGLQITALGGMAGNNATLNAYIFVAALNNLGAAAGWGFNASGYERAIFWDPSGTPAELVPIADQTQPFLSHALAVSDTNLIAGYSQIGDQYDSTHATLWSASNGAAPLDLPDCFAGTPPPADFFGVSDEAVSISPGGQYVGGYCQQNLGAEADLVAAIWVVSPAAPTTASLVKFSGTEVLSVNNSGMGAGVQIESPANCVAVDGCKYPMLFDATKGTTKTLAVLARGVTNAGGSATSINTANVVVGSSMAADGNFHAVLWSATGRLTDLNAVMTPLLPKGQVLAGALQITDAGEILAYAVDAAAQTYYYRLTPVLATRVAISSTGNPAAYGQPIQLKASVLPTSGVIPSGQVEWFEDGVSVGTAPLDSTGVASFTPTSWQPGVHRVTAHYLGASPDGASNSGTLVQTITKGLTHVSLSSSSSTPVHGQSFNLVAQASAAFGTLYGKVIFYNGGTPIGSVTLDSTGSATQAVTVPAAGTYKFSATYFANLHFDASVSPALALTVQ